jgi:beta-lactamase superfamily II metal-dependent hydrolase
VLVALLAVLALAAPGLASAAGFKATFVSVGQGDATVFEGPCGELAVLDAPSSGVDAVLSILDRAGSRNLKWLGVSHYDADHLGGIVKLATKEGVQVNVAVDRGGGPRAKKGKGYTRYQSWLTSTGVDHLAPAIGDQMVLCEGTDPVVFEVVSVGSDGTAVNGLRVPDENDKGLCFKITYRRFSMASCGDSNGETVGKRRDLESPVAPLIGKVDVAKVNHHGSIHSSNPLYVETLAPSVAVVSVGKNSYGHPHPRVLRRWDAVGDVYQTALPNGSTLDGNVVVSTDGRASFVVTTKNSGVERQYALGDEGSGPLSESQTSTTEEDQMDIDIDEALNFAYGAAALLAALVGATIAIIASRLAWHRDSSGHRIEDPSTLAPALALLDDLRSYSGGTTEPPRPVSRGEVLDRWNEVRSSLIEISLAHEASEVRKAAEQVRRSFARVVRAHPPKEAEIEETEDLLRTLAELMRA